VARKHDFPNQDYIDRNGSYLVMLVHKIPGKHWIACH